MCRTFSLLVLSVMLMAPCLDAGAGRRTEVHLFGGDISDGAPLASSYRTIGITDVWLYPIKGAFPQDQAPESQQRIDALKQAGTLDAYKKESIRYWCFERPVPDFAYETEKRADKPGLHLWDSSPETDAFWKGVCERAAAVYSEVRAAGFAGLVYDGEAYYSFKGDESGKEKPWVWGGHAEQHGAEGNYFKRGLQLGKAIQGVWPGAKVILVYAFGYPGERWWYQGFKEAGLDVYLGLEHTYGAGPARPGGEWYQSWWQGRKTKATCDWKRTLFPFIADNQHMIAGLFPLDFGVNAANYRAQHFREQMDSAANDDPGGPIAVWLWPPFTPEGVSKIKCLEGDSTDDYLKVLRDYSCGLPGNGEAPPNPRQ